MTDCINHATTNDEARPYWIPPSVDLECLPEEIRAAILGIINPAYRELVLKAQNGLEKAAGVTIVSLLWMEILDHVQMGREIGDTFLLTTPSEDCEKRIARHLRLVGAKIKAASFLQRLREFREKYGHAFGTSMDWIETINPPAEWPEDVGEV